MRTPTRTLEKCITLLTQIPIHAILSISSVVNAGGFKRKKEKKKKDCWEASCVTIAYVERNSDNYFLHCASLILAVIKKDTIWAWEFAFSFSFSLFTSTVLYSSSLLERLLCNYLNSWSLSYNCLDQLNCALFLRCNDTLHISLSQPLCEEF